MPKISVRSMSIRQRRRHSLSAKTFRTTALSCVAMGLVSLLLGLVIYTVSMANQYINHAVQLATIARSSAIMGADGLGLADRVMEKYRALTEEQRAGTGTEAYRAIFSEELESRDYDVLVHMLGNYLKSEYVYDVYLAMYDERTCAMVYVVDPEKESRLYPGEWESVTEEGMRKFLDWDGTGRLYDIDYTANYGWLCTAGLPLQDESGVTRCFLLVDIDVRNLISGIRDFSLSLSASMLVLTALIAWIITRRMKRTTVRPINDIFKAAEAYTADRKAGNTATKHFAALNIHTGDEVENLSLTMADMERELTEYVDQLTAVTAEKERIGTELALAKKIQYSMLPNVFPPFPERPEIDIYAVMDPAREVGGDFYDFYLLDEDHLCLTIADVSGKGIPAALFMMIVKNLLQSYASLGQSPAEVLSNTNEAICSKNPEDMFVTVWLGILELSTGRLTAASAGHEYPALLEQNGDFVLYKDPHGLVVGGMEGTQYRNYSLELQPGAKLFVYTDGVPEASNKDNALFGTDRMLEALNRQPEAGPEQLLRNVRQAVDLFVQDAEQFDDLTMLCVEYKGGSMTEQNGLEPRAETDAPQPETTDSRSSSGEELVLPARVENLERVQRFVADRLGEDCSPKTRMQLDLAVEEIFVNIASYAYAPGEGQAAIRVEHSESPASVTLVFRDSGVPYDPLAREDPDVEVLAGERQIGGLGIFLTKQVMDELHYEHTDGQNVLTMKKRL